MRGKQVAGESTGRPSGQQLAALSDTIGATARAIPVLLEQLRFRTLTRYLRPMKVMVEAESAFVISPTSSFDLSGFI